MGVFAFVAEEVDVCGCDFGLWTSGGEEGLWEVVGVGGVERGEIFGICCWTARCWCFGSQGGHYVGCEA